MSFEVLATAPFERKLKRLARKYRSIKNDLSPLFEQLANEPTQGISLGKGCYKIRFAIASKGGGKSGGGRLITLVKIVNEKVYLLDVYDKADQDTITDQELEKLIDRLTNDLNL